MQYQGSITIRLPNVVMSDRRNASNTERMQMRLPSGEGDLQTSVAHVTASSH